MTIVDKDMGWDELGRTIERLADGTAYVLVGIQGAEGEAQHGQDGMTNIELGTIHEFGLGVPERSFIRVTIDNYKRPLADMMAKLGQRVLLDEITEDYALALVGEYAVGVIKERIQAHIPPPLSEETKKRKGSDTPLIEHGTLWRSITYKLWSQV